MSLKKEIDARRAHIKTDAYSTSVGELISMYKEGELDIHPEFQRFFRWSQLQKSRFIESLLLGIPIPSIFVAQRDDGVWDVVDGLQRISTVLELVGELKDEDGKEKPRLLLCGTKYLPSLEGKQWEDGAQALDREQQLLIKRSKFDVKIVLRESDESSKYELFQRLNTGGSALSDQELRNCIVIMADKEFFAWMRSLSVESNFIDCASLSDRAMDEQYDLELVVRFLVFRRIAVDSLSTRALRDLGSFLNDAVVDCARSRAFSRKQEALVFRGTFALLAASLGEDAFRRFDHSKKRFAGPFLISGFEAVALGVGHNIDAWKKQKDVAPTLRERVQKLWKQTEFLDGIGSGVAASDRLPATVAFGRKFFEP